MSAYIVDIAHVRYLLAAALHTAERGDAFRWYHNGTHYELHHGDLERAAVIGQMLWSENVRSVTHRYPDSADAGDLPGPVEHGEHAGYGYAHRAWTDPTAFAPAQILKACHCYEYQSCEHDGWEASEAHAFCESLRRSAERMVPGYESAAWGAPPERTGVVLLSSLCPPRARR